MAIESVGGGASRSGAAIAHDDGMEPTGGTALDRLANHVSALDRLVADAGALGKFRADQPDALPAGTGSFTVPVSQTIAHVEARLGSPHERVLGTTQAQPPREAVQAARQPDVLEPGVRPVTIHSSAATMRPDVALDTENRAATLLRGNRTTAGA
jgi:hypothetical protein